MKSLTIHLLRAAFACPVIAGAASAAEMKFEVPFDFQAGGKVLPAGTYSVQASVNEHDFFLTNTRTNLHLVLLSQAETDPQAGWQQSRRTVMQFACDKGHYQLEQIWTNRGYPAHKVSIIKAGHVTHLALMSVATPK